VYHLRRKEIDHIVVIQGKSLELLEEKEESKGSWWSNAE
jgi:hypothetical protein